MLCVRDMPGRASEGRAQVRLSRTIVRTLHSSALPCKLSIESEEANRQIELMVPKGLITLAMQLCDSNACNLAEHGNFLIRMKREEGALSDSALPTTLTLCHRQHPSADDDELAHMSLNAWHAITTTITPELKVNNFMDIAEHVWKKHAVVPETDLVGTVQTPALPRTLEQFAAQHVFTRSLPASSGTTIGQSQEERISTPGKFRTLFHFNTKLISMLQSNGCEQSVERSRAAVLNSSLAWNSTFSSDKLCLISAETMEVVPLGAPLSQNKHDIATRLSVKTSAGIQKIAVYQANYEARQILSAAVGRCRHRKTRQFYCFSKNNIPILLTPPSTRKVMQVNMSRMEAGNAAICQRPIVRTHELQTSSEALWLLQCAQVIHRSNSAGAYKSTRTNAWHQFVTTWLQHASAALPLHKTLFAEAANMRGCKSLHILLAEAPSFAHVRHTQP